MPADRILLLPQAEEDLEDIWFYTRRQWSEEQADRYHRGIMGMIEDLASRRKQGRPVGTRPGYLRQVAFSHVIYYRDLGDRIEIVRILHGAQDSGRNP